MLLHLPLSVEKIKMLRRKRLSVINYIKKSVN
ncbi:hypothetical protein MNBD_DELTA04-282, partial [hydrothermal vent metagenome]